MYPVHHTTSNLQKETKSDQPCLTCPKKNQIKKDGTWKFNLAGVC